MLLYDWKKILNKSSKSSKEVVRILDTLVRLKVNPDVIPRNRWDPLYKYYYEDFSGHSFLLDPYSLIAYKYKWTDKEIADYIGLASFRNLGMYKAFGTKTLDISLSPLTADNINKNRLLHIESNNIHFLYEDYTRSK